MENNKLEIINKNLICLDMDSSNKEEVIQQLSDVLLKEGCINNVEIFMESVNERETHETTGIGDGIAIPHGKSDSVIKNSVIMARLKNKVEWMSMDDEPVNIVFLLAIKESNAGDVHLRILSKLAENLMEPEFVTKMKNEEDIEEICRTLNFIQ